jgi:hypothetical protein
MHICFQHKLLTLTNSNNILPFDRTTHTKQIWLDPSGTGASGQSVNDKQPKDTVNLGGTAVYWPAWIWALYALVIVCLVCPLMACLYRRRRNKEIEREVYTVMFFKYLHFVLLVS